MIELLLENPDQVFVQRGEREPETCSACSRTISPGDILRFRRALGAGNGLVAADSFPPLLGESRGVFTLEQAVRKMTHDNAGLRTRGPGLVKQGYCATWCCSKRTAYARTYEDRDRPAGRRPRLVQKADGIRATSSWRDHAGNGESTGNFAGQVLKARQH